MTEDIGTHSMGIVLPEYSLFITWNVTEVLGNTFRGNTVVKSTGWVICFKEESHDIGTCIFDRTRVQIYLFITSSINDYRCPPISIFFAYKTPIILPVYVNSVTAIQKRQRSFFITVDQCFHRVDNIWPKVGKKYTILSYAFHGSRLKRGSMNRAGTHRTHIWYETLALQHLWSLVMIGGLHTTGFCDCNYISMLEIECRFGTLRE